MIPYLCKTVTKTILALCAGLLIGCSSQQRLAHNSANATIREYYIQENTKLLEILEESRRALAKENKSWQDKKKIQQAANILTALDSDYKPPRIELVPALYLPLSDKCAGQYDPTTHTVYLAHGAAFKTKAHELGHAQDKTYNRLEHAAASVAELVGLPAGAATRAEFMADLHCEKLADSIYNISGKNSVSAHLAEPQYTSLPDNLPKVGTLEELFNELSIRGIHGAHARADYVNVLAHGVLSRRNSKRKLHDIIEKFSYATIIRAIENEMNRAGVERLYAEGYKHRQDLFYQVSPADYRKLVDKIVSELGKGENKVTIPLKVSGVPDSFFQCSVEKERKDCKVTFTKQSTILPDKISVVIVDYNANGTIDRVMEESTRKEEQLSKEERQYYEKVYVTVMNQVKKEAFSRTNQQKKNISRSYDPKENVEKIIKSLQTTVQGKKSSQRFSFTDEFINSTTQEKIMIKYSPKNSCFTISTPSKMYVDKNNDGTLDTVYQKIKKGNLIYYKNMPLKNRQQEEYQELLQTIKYK